jgi:hypothetical protein
LDIQNTILASVFKQTSHRGIHSQWEGVPDEAFMILIMNERPCLAYTALPDIEVNSMNPCKRLKQDASMEADL